MSDKKTATASTSDAVEKKTKNIGEAKTTSQTEKTVSDDGFCVYLGPTITGVVQTGTVYSGSKEKVLFALDETIKKFPLIAKLIVTGKDLPEARVKVKTPGNILYVNYHKLCSGRKN